ncbi:MAG: chemotaxis protein CheW [Spirochaetia bacterium]|jgi:purine-binding chemotaxis protein CheW
MSAERIDWTEIHQRMAAAEAAIAHAGRASGDETRAVLKTRAEALARENDDGALAREYLEVVSFLLGQEKYGVESCYVREVWPLNELTPLPGTPPFVLGIVNVRGQVLSVIDIRKLFDLPQKGVGDLDRIIVLQNGVMELGILGNSILGVVQIPTDELQPTLPTLTGLRGEYLKGVTPDRMAILNAARLLSDENIIVREEA